MYSYFNFKLDLINKFHYHSLSKTPDIFSICFAISFVDYQTMVFFLVNLKRFLNKKNRFQFLLTVNKNNLPIRLKIFTKNGVIINRAVTRLTRIQRKARNTNAGHETFVNHLFKFLVSNQSLDIFSYQKFYRVDLEINGKIRCSHDLKYLHSKKILDKWLNWLKR